MYWPGHYGAALLAYAPLGLLVSIAGHEAAAIVGGGVVLGLAMVPDYDLRVPLVEHRGPTHSMAFAVLVGAALAGAAAALVGAESAFVDAGFVAFAFLLGFVSVCSHLLADALTPAGIRPFWPLSNRRYSLGVTTASSALGNYLLLAVGLVAFGLAAAGVAVLV